MQSLPGPRSAALLCSRGSRRQGELGALQPLGRAPVPAAWSSRRRRAARPPPALHPPAGSEELAGGDPQGRREGAARPRSRLQQATGSPDPRAKQPRGQLALPAGATCALMRRAAGPAPGPAQRRRGDAPFPAPERGRPGAAAAAALGGGERAGGRSRRPRLEALSSALRGRAAPAQADRWSVQVQRQSTPGGLWRRCGGRRVSAGRPLFPCGFPPSETRGWCLIQPAGLFFGLNEADPEESIGVLLGHKR